MKQHTSVLRFISAVVLLCVAVGSSAQQTAALPKYKNSSAPIEERVKDLLGRMTLEEKVSMLAGAGWMESVAVPRLGIPSIKMADGPMGVRSWLGSSALTSAPGAKQSFTSTAFPAGVALAATWDVELSRREGQAIAQELKGVGRDMILGPTVNIQRVPLWGRNFEGYGEDPYLAAMIGVGYIKGVQSEGIIATVKHFAANNEEFERHRIDEAIDERTLQEIYFPAFKAAVQQGGVWSVMSAYNKVNGTYCAENEYLLKQVLKKQWGFKGFVVSDWGSTYSTAGTVNAGMDLEMPGGEIAKKWLQTENVKKAGNGADWLSPEKVLAEIKAGRIPVASVDDNVTRILRVLFLSGQFDHPHTPLAAELDTPEHRKLARTVAAESIVLLKNDGNLLPLDITKLNSIAVIGASSYVARTGGGGSSRVNPKYAVSPLNAIKQRAAGRLQVNYAPGWGGLGDSQAKEVVEGRKQLMDEALELATKADVAIVVVGNTPKIESEGYDRKTLDLPEGEDEIVQAVAKANKNTIVVINSGGPVNVSKWIGVVPSVLSAWFGGQEVGNGIADVLFGDVNPSGKLPFTWINDFAQSPAYGNYPGENLHVKYGEGIYVGYRYFDKKDIKPQFPFGYGLSYTTFEYSGVKITPAKSTGQVQVSLQVRNTGKREGSEVVQLYLRDVQSSVDRPVKELKGFNKVTLKPGESKTITFALDRYAMSFYSTAKKNWVAEPGQFEVLVGASSRDIRLKGTFDLLK